MGCTWYVRRDHKDAELKGFFLHGDCQGQYGEDTNDIPKAEAFVSNYEKIRQEF